MQAISSLLSLAPATAVLVVLDADNKPVSEEVLNANLIHNRDILKVHSSACTQSLSAYYHWSVRYVGGQDTC